MRDVHDRGLNWPRRSVLGATSLVALSLASCRFVRTSSLKGGRSADQSSSGGEDPEHLAAKLWTPKIVPYVVGRAAPLSALTKQIAQSPAAALADHGTRPSATDAPPVYAVRFDGKIIAADTAGMAGTISIDTTGDGKPDATVQVGPIIHGTSLRDVIPFVGFNSFPNQIDYAEFARALNHRARDTALKGFPRNGLVGRTVTGVGAFRPEADGSPPLITPVQIALGEAGR